MGSVVQCAACFLYAKQDQNLFTTAKYSQRCVFYETIHTVQVAQAVFSPRVPNLASMLVSYRPLARVPSRFVSCLWSQLCVFALFCDPPIRPQQCSQPSAWWPATHRDRHQPCFQHPSHGQARDRKPKEVPQEEPKKSHRSRSRRPARRRHPGPRRPRRHTKETCTPPPRRCSSMQPDYDPEARRRRGATQTHGSG